MCPARGRWYKDGCWLVCGLSQRLLSDDLFWPPCFILLCPLLFVLANGSVHVDGRAFGNMAPPSESTLLHVPLTPVHPRSRGGTDSGRKEGSTKRRHGVGGDRISVIRPMGILLQSTDKSRLCIGHKTRRRIVWRLPGGTGSTLFLSSPAERVLCRTGFGRGRP